MTDKDDYLLVDAEETHLRTLLGVVREGHRAIRMTSHGQPLADLAALALKRFGPPDPRPRPTLHAGGHEITTEEDWPPEVR